MRKEPRWTKYDIRKSFELSTKEREVIGDKISSAVLNVIHTWNVDGAIRKGIVGDYNGRSGKVIKASDFIRQLYIMRYILELPTREISSYLGMSCKTLNYKMVQLEWQYSKHEAQQIAANKSRNYSEISSKSRETRIKGTIDKGVLDGSIVESSIRSILNERLTALIKDAIVIVGVSNRSIIAPKEVDIPIVILKGSETLKFCVEVNGDYFHTKEKDENKNKLLESKDFTCFYVKISSSTMKQRELYGDMDSQIQNICTSIVKIVGGD
jgi:hypothetical protein